jgi:peroxiredoxin
MLRNGTPAPGFALRDDTNNEQSLIELHGGAPLVLYFFRGDFCPTARRDLMNYNDAYSRFRAAGANLVAISADTPGTLHLMKFRLGLQFPLLSDSSFETSRAYGVYESDDGEGPQPHGEPAVFIVDVDGNIAFSQIQTGPKAHANPAELAMILFYMQQNGGRY